MGDLIGEAVEGTLYYVPPEEFKRIGAIKTDTHTAAAVFGNLCRINVLYMIARAGSGHIGSSFSSLDMLSWLFLHELKHANDLTKPDADLFYSSKGHDAPALYAVLMAMGKLPFENIHRLRRIDGLPGHPDVNTPHIVANTGSLGMGISKAKGMVTASRLQGKKHRVVVLTGDGELQEGQIWESLGSAANNKLHEITVIVDHNKLQSDTFVAQVSDLGDLPAKFAAFGWHVARIDGHDLKAFDRTLREFDKITDKPKVIIADTVKGRGVSFMEHTSLDSDTAMYRFHSGAPDAASYTKAVQELIEGTNKNLEMLGATPLAMETVERPPAAAPMGPAPQRLIPAYTDALMELAKADDKIIALDADLVLDTGLIPFKEQMGARFVECGIAEQDMVSQAGGMAMLGMKPMVHSFSCFLTPRPNEQMYNNATEGKKVTYVGSLAGLLPGGPGHSHQAVRDIATMRGIPGLIMAEPSCPAEVAPLLNTVMQDMKESVYFRLVSVPWPINFELPKGYKPEAGKGCVLKDGKDVVLFAYGPIMLSVAHQAAELLAKKNISLKIINMPWLNRADVPWCEKAIGGAKLVVALDNHVTDGGQGDTLLAALMRPVLKLGVEGIPRSGTHDEVLAHHKLDAASIASRIEAAFTQGKACLAVAS